MSSKRAGRKILARVTLTEASFLDILLKEIKKENHSEEELERKLVGYSYKDSLVRDRDILK